MLLYAEEWSFDSICEVHIEILQSTNTAMDFIIKILEFIKNVIIVLCELSIIRCSIINHNININVFTLGLKNINL